MSNSDNTPCTINIRVAHEHSGNWYTCDHICINSQNQGEDLMMKLHCMNYGDSDRVGRFLSASKDLFLMQQVSVWLVSLSLVSMPEHTYHSSRQMLNFNS
jgi:hypothetical protein